MWHLPSYLEFEADCVLCMIKTQAQYDEVNVLQ